MSSSFKASYEGIGQLLVSEEMQLEMLRRARKMMAFAIADAPYDPADKDGDHYRDHFFVDSGIQEGKTRRAYGRMGNDHPAAVSIEYGTGEGGSRTPAHHTVLRSIDAARD
jgi:hypothetical protein